MMLISAIITIIFFFLLTSAFAPATVKGSDEVSQQPQRLLPNLPVRAPEEGREGLDRAVDGKEKNAKRRADEANEAEGGEGESTGQGAATAARATTRDSREEGGANVEEGGGAGGTNVTEEEGGAEEGGRRLWGAETEGG